MVIVRLRFTALFLLVMLAANWLAVGWGQDLSHEALSDWGVGHNTLLSGDVFRLISSIFLSHDAGMFIRQLIFAAVVIGYTEWRRGSTQTALLFFGLDIVGTLLLLACVGLVQGMVAIDITAMNDVGMSIGGFGLIGLALSSWRYKWGLLSALLVAIAIKLAVDSHILADVGHFLALLLGFALGQIFLIITSYDR